jgi:hypothetical protein
MKSNIKIHKLILVPSLLLLSGCPGPFPGSQPYKPLPRWERQFFRKAKRDIYPNDVRKSPETYEKTLVVWPGIIKSITIDTEDGSQIARFIIEHHYFDWIEDQGIQRERFFLSPRGEGLFALAWRVDIEEDKLFIEQFAVDDMIIAYGYPSMIKDDLIGFYPTQNIRGIKPKWYRTDVLDYGRPGKAVQSLKVPF